MTTSINGSGGSGPAFDPCALIAPELFEELVHRVGREQITSERTAERIVSQMIAFLKVCVDNPEERHAPSFQVGWAWRTFILHTKEYAEFCSGFAGRFLHHDPADENPRDEAVLETAARMRTMGLPVDEEIWSPEGTPCFHDLHEECGDI